MQRLFSYLDIELSFSHHAHSNAAVLIIRRIGQHVTQAAEKSWLTVFTKMYLQWIHKKGYTYYIYQLVLPHKEGTEPKFIHHESKEFKSLLQRIEEEPNPEVFVIFVEGAYVYGFLKGEEGIHRLKGKLGGIDTGGHIYMVKVEAQDYSGRPKSWYEATIKQLAEVRKKNRCSWFGALTSGDEEKAQDIVRKFELGEKSSVEDPQTKVTTRAVEEVLNGSLDPFILARVRLQAAILEDE